MDVRNRRSSARDDRTTDQVENTLEQLCVVQKNPLLIDMILQSLFSFVDYETLKNCRLVTKKWKELSDAKFVLKSAVVFNDKKNGILASIMESPPANIQDLFASINTDNTEYIRFTAFAFRADCLTQRKREVCIEPQVTIMRELEICCSVRSTVLDDLIGPNLKKLKIYPRGSVSLQKLSTIPQIYLDCCTILLNRDVKIKPKKLKLNRCHFNGKDQNVIVTQMRDIVDFGSLDKLELCSDGSGMRLTLNFSDFKSIKDISLTFVHINLDAKIAPEKITLEDVFYEVSGLRVSSKVVLADYLTSAQMKKIYLKDGNLIFDFNNSVEIDELYLGGDTKIRGRMAEANIRKLVFNRRRSLKDVGMSGLVNLPNLKHLGLIGCVKLLPYFQQCLSLTCVSLEEHDTTVEKLNLDLLPPNIDSLSLAIMYQYKFVGNRHIKLKTLVLAFHPNSEVLSYYENKISKHIQTDVLVFRTLEPWGWGSDEQQECIIQKILIIQQKIKIKKIALGKLQWFDEDNFEKSALFPLLTSHLSITLLKIKARDIG